MDLVSLYLSPHGRMPRHVYWLASLPLLPLSFVPDLLMTTAASWPSVLFSLAVLAALMIPSCILSIKRCHDRDRSGWFTLIGLIPLIGTLWLLIDLGFLPGTAGPNRFGPDPRTEMPDGDLAITA